MPYLIGFQCIAMVVLTDNSQKVTWDTKLILDLKQTLVQKMNWYIYIVKIFFKMINITLTVNDQFNKGWHVSVHSVTSDKGKILCICTSGFLYEDGCILYQLLSC